ncbi:MAG: PD40 domain-containing protein [Alistipes sp.]|nr:PD40 domain-containing protein [Candidatus Minthomonas equi]
MKRCALFCMVLGILACGCRRELSEPLMFPDYRGVTVPCNIAPLNFYYDGKGSADAVTTFEAGCIRVEVKGREVCPARGEWAALLEAALGGSVHVTSSLFGEWDIEVSRDSVDSYLTYRLIEPGYEVWNHVAIVERDLTSFAERTLSSWENTGNACMNCHIHKGENSMFYLRGKNGGAIYSRGGGGCRKLNLKKDGMASGTVYGDIHPSGRWGVFSTNIIIPGFHTGTGRRLEVYDTVSDLCVTDFDNDTILIADSFARPDRFETFPCFSADGSQVFYCSADTVTLPRQVEQLRYSLYRTPFDSITGKLGPQVENVWDAAIHKGSVCHPKASPDGKWLVFTVADYGTFPIWHRECDLWIMNLSTGESRPMNEINSPEFSDSYHSWSSDGHWMVFASKRDDGQYGKPWFCHIDSDGKASRPFILPQEDPHLYDKTLKSFNIPDLGKYPAPYDSVETGRIWKEVSAENFH